MCNLTETITEGFIGTQSELENAIEEERRQMNCFEYHCLGCPYREGWET